MTRKVFTVWNRGGWRIVVEGRQGLPYADPEAAIKAAIVSAQLASRDDTTAEVLIERPNGELKRVWQSGDVVPFSGRSR